MLTRDKKGNFNMVWIPAVDRFIEMKTGTHNRTGLYLTNHQIILEFLAKPVHQHNSKIHISTLIVQKLPLVKAQTALKNNNK